MRNIARMFLSLLIGTLLSMCAKPCGEKTVCEDRSKTAEQGIVDAERDISAGSMKVFRYEELFFVGGEIHENPIGRFHLQKVISTAWPLEYYVAYNSTIDRHLTRIHGEEYLHWRTAIMPKKGAARFGDRIAKSENSWPNPVNSRLPDLK